MRCSLMIIIGLFTTFMVSQQTISLRDCYQLATVNYPLAKQSQLLETQYILDKELALKWKLPQISFDAQATYQSDVIEIPIPIPNSTIEAPNKDQFRSALSINQLIYNGGAIDASLNVKSAQFKAKLKQVEVNVYQLKQKINQLYFSVLLSQETELLLKAKQTLLKAKLSEVISGIKYGVLLPTSDKVLEAESLKLEQQLIEVESNKTTLIETLSSIIGEPLKTHIIFENIALESNSNSELIRPELELFQLKKEEIESNEALIAKQSAPKLIGFATGGYGNPGLNMLDNSFQSFYIIGVKLNWIVFDWNSNKKQRESLAINKDIIDTEAETFKLNTNTELNQQHKEIVKIEAIISNDLQIIHLRKEVLEAADSQLKNGVITASAYITELTNLYEDENSLMKHKIQLQLATANYNVIKGE